MFCPSGGSRQELLVVRRGSLDLLHPESCDVIVYADGNVTRIVSLNTGIPMKALEVFFETSRLGIGTIPIETKISEKIRPSGKQLRIIGLLQVIEQHMPRFRVLKGNCDAIVFAQ